MAKKRTNPIEDPPTASSSSSEEEEKAESSEEEEEEEEGGGSSSEEEEEKTQTPKNLENSAAAAAVESDESDTDSGTDSSDSNVKPIATKSMDETSNAKKSRSKTTTSSVNATKRPNESVQEPKEVKRAKKKAEEDGTTRTAPTTEEAKKTGEDTKKQLFQRLFSEDDEIALLKGMLDYYTRKGTDPCSDMNAFYDFVKKSIHTDVTKAQLMDKIRRLKKKFENSVKGKSGEDKTFNKPHEQKAFDLSKKIWGKDGFTGKIESSAVKSNGKAKKKNNVVAVLKEEVIASPEKKVGGWEAMDVDKKGSNSRGILFNKWVGVAGVEEEVLKHGLEMVGAEKRVALEEKWRKLQVAELELFLRRTELVKEQAEMLLEFYKS